MIEGFDAETVAVGDGTRLHVQSAGEGEPVVLLHGWPQHGDIWRHVAPELVAAGRRVVVADLRGHGRSAAPPGDYAKATFASDVLDVLDALGLDQVDLVGHDWGGWTGFLLALDHPERVRRYVAVDIGPPWRTSPTPRQALTPVFLAYQYAIISPLGPTLLRRPEALRRLIRAGSGPDMHWTREDLDRYAHSWGAPDRIAASQAIYRTFLTREAAPALGRAEAARRLQVPTRLVMGAASWIGWITGDAGTPLLERVDIPRCGHFVAEEKPAELLAEIRRHFEI